MVFDLRENVIQLRLFKWALPIHPCYSEKYEFYRSTAIFFLNNNKMC